MLLHGMEVSPDDLNNWGSGTLKKFRNDLEEKLLNNKEI